MKIRFFRKKARLSTPQVAGWKAAFITIFRPMRFCVSYASRSTFAATELARVFAFEEGEYP